MNNPGLYTYKYPLKSDLSKKDDKNSAVNIYINGVNTPSPNNCVMPQQYPVCQYPYAMPTQSYVYYIPYNFQQNNNNIAAQNLDKSSSTKEKKSDKPVTPITEQLLKGLNGGLLHGDKQTRMHSVARVINLLREDDPARRTDPRFIDLINNALHPNQSEVIRATALSAVHNDAVKGNELTRQYLTEMAGKNNKSGSSGLAAITLGQLSPPNQRFDYTSKENDILYSNKNPNPGQKLNLIST